MNGLQLIAAAALAGMAVAAAIGVLLPRRDARRARVALLLAGAAPAGAPPEAEAGEAVDARPAARLLPREIVAGLRRLGLSFEDLDGALRPWHMALAGTAAAAAALLLLAGLLHLPWWAAIAAALPAALGGVWLAFRTARERRRARFLDHFPDAIDLIVRGVKAGLPVVEAIMAVGRDVPGPVGLEFRRIADQLGLGLPLEQALWQSAARVGVADFRIFVVSLSLQRETGGSLAETLSNLGGVIRRRKELRLKTKALSAEARASALVISALPFLAGGALFLISPNYARRFLADPRGGYLLAGALAELGLGIGIMRLLIKWSVR